MAKSYEKIEARKLRAAGESIKEIARRLGVSKSSASIWCRDIELTARQMEALRRRMIKGSYVGRMKGARMQHERRLKQIILLRENGGKMLKWFAERDLLAIGAGIYWGEGFKKSRAGISNSDPLLIKLMLRWFQTIWGVSRDRVECRVLINETHKTRINEVEKYWARQLCIPMRQFRSTTFIKAKNKKVYENFAQHYGTLSVRIKRGSDIGHQIRGLIDKAAKELKATIKNAKKLPLSFMRPA